MMRNQSKTNIKAKQRAYRWGKYAEILALLWLLCKGYMPLAWRKKMPFEADLIMRRGNLLLLVEVKYRQNMVTGLQAITHHKQQKLHKIAGMMQVHYRDKFKQTPHIRIDAVIITPYGLRHIHNISQI